MTEPTKHGETPRTDAIVDGIASIEDRYVPLRELARQLERELTEARGELEGAHRVVSDAGIERSRCEDSDMLVLIGLSARISMMRQQLERDLEAARGERADRGTWTDPKWVTFNAMQWRAFNQAVSGLDELVQEDDSLCVCDYGDQSVGMPETTCDVHALMKVREEVLQDNFPPPQPTPQAGEE